MLKTLHFIHSHGITHLDVKPDNIFIHQNIYKLGDLGFSTSSRGDFYVRL